METKLAKLKRAMAAKDWKAALGIASKFYDLGAARNAVLSARAAMLSPGIYRQMGRDPALVIEEGIRALVERYARPSNPAPAESKKGVSNV